MIFYAVTAAFFFCFTIGMVIAIQFAKRSKANGQPQTDVSVGCLGLYL